MCATMRSANDSVLLLISAFFLGKKKHFVQHKEHYKLYNLSQERIQKKASPKKSRHVTTATKITFAMEKKQRQGQFTNIHSCPRNLSEMKYFPALMADRSEGK